MVCLLAIAVLGGARLGDSVWIEGENPTEINVKANIGGWGHKEFLSGEKWLQVSVDADKIDKELPADGVHISYKFSTAEAGSHEIWNRIGYEAVRSSFDWRVDNEPWRRITPEQLTTDMQEFATWNEVAWIKMGDENLTPGSHTMEIRLPKTVDSKGKPERVLYASDALLISTARFHPNGKFAPGQEYRSDVDLKAEATKYEAKDIPGPERQTISLGGLWQIAREDEELPGRVDVPIDRLPNDPMWYGISVPSDKNQARPELTMAHRIWYRTRVVVPQGQLGRSFRLTFPQNSLNTTVYVNGALCGFNKNPFVNWDCDVTSAVKAGENEILVGIRDAWYGYSSSPTDPMKLRRAFVIPLAFTGNGFQDLAYPVWHGFMSGILDAPSLTIAGPIAVTDVFVKPSVANKRLSADIEVSYRTRVLRSPHLAELKVEAIDDKAGGVVKDLGTTQVALPPAGRLTVHVDAPWLDPTLWWPDQPKMYRLRISVISNGQTSDVSETPFGFREWSWHGKNLLLNGIVWHGWAELTQGATKEEWLQNYRKTGQRFMRLSGVSQNGGVQWQGMSYEKALDWFDRNGVIVRRCGPLDGEAIGYNAIENDPELQALYHTRIKKQLLDNWRDQMVAQVRGERNHPSVGMWSVENEWLYINCINLYGDLMDDFEREEKATFDAIAVVDPTRPAMADGGGAGKANLFPIQGDHYVYSNDPNRYPDLAYEAFPEGAGRGRWRWDEKRPRYIGEDFFATGINPADYAWIEGEEAFGGKTESEKGMAMVQRMLTEGYRWSGEYSAWHLWIGSEGAKFGKYIPNSERAVFCRQHDWSFGSGQVVRRTFGIFNDSHYDDPLTFTYKLRVGDKTIDSGSKVLPVAPGTRSIFDVSPRMPKVESRKTGELLLTLTAKGVIVFKDRKELSILPPDPIASDTSVGVFDPSNKLSAVLRVQGFKLVPVLNLGAIPKSVRVLVVAPDALTEAESAKTELAAFAAEGRRVVVLDQNHPLHYQALPVEIPSTTEGGEFAFPEIPEHPVFAGLTTADFQGWTGGVYRNAYTKPERGARSLLQVGSKLASTALVEVPVGEGLLLLSQIKTRLGSERHVVSEILLKNLIKYAETYHPISRQVAVAADDDPLLLAALVRTGLKFDRKAHVLATLEGDGARIAIVSASPGNLHTLAQNMAKVKDFYARGGTIVFHGLTPDGLSDYDRIVGVEHLIRPFRREKTAVRIPRDPLAAGLSSSNVVMYSGEKMFDFNDDRFVASDIFSYVVDYDDAAPFANLPSEYLYNTVNGFVSSDGWKYIYSFDLEHSKPEYTMTFSRPQTFTELNWTGNGFYHKVTKLSLMFDGKDTVTFDVQPNTNPQALAISPARTGKTIELKILDWTKDQGISNVVGIDNISLKAARTPEFYRTVHPLLNVGGLVRYSIGKGGAVLVNLFFKEREEVPENAEKKLAVLSTILHNLNAPFTGGKTVVAGATNIEYQSIDISKRANQYRNERGWFGDKQTTFADLPSGRHAFAGVPFDVFDFPTSPVPNAVMLGGPGVPGNLPSSVEGIPVGTKASALFFLQAARIDQRRNGDELRDDKRLDFSEYEVHYADGQTTVIPIYLEVDVEDYRQASPHALPGAQVAWTHAYGSNGLNAVAYVHQWNNPRPDVEIRSIDLRYGPDLRGVPVLLALTAAK